MSRQLCGQKWHFSIVQVCAGLLFVGGLLATVVLIARPSLARDSGSTIADVAKPLLSAASQWRNSNPEGCPTIGGLIHEGVLSESAVRHDPWGGAFRLVCLDEGSFVLLSPGRDGQLGTDDDLEYPRRQ
jgi:hypothetical protein